MLPFWPKLSRQGRIFFHWAKLHPTELHCILLNYVAPFSAPLHPPAPYGSTRHPTKLCCIQLSCAAHNLS